MRRTVENIRRGGGERAADPRAVSWYVKILLWIPLVLRIFIGAAGVLSLLLAHGKLSKTTMVHEWWQVILPCTTASGLLLACTSVAVVLWFVGTLRVVALQRQGNRAADRGADSLIKLAKATIGTNGWALLVFLFLWLLGVRLQHGPSIPLIYPFTPLIILGCAHLFLATLLVEPEVDSVRSFGCGISLLVHSTVLVLMFDSGEKLNDSQWVYVFIPSWATYAWIVGLCIIRRQAVHEALLEAEMQVGEKAKARIHELRELLKSIIGMALWAVFFCAAHVLLVWRLTYHTMNVRWSLIFTLALLGWMAFIGAAVAPMTSCAQDCVVELLSIAGVRVPVEDAMKDTEATPLLAENN